MPIVKVVPNNYPDMGGVSRTTDYVFKDEKIPSNIVGGYGVLMTSPEAVMNSIYNVVEVWSQQDCANKLRHIVVSFKKNVGLTNLDYIGNSMCNYYGLNGYQCFYAVHEDTDHIHLHFIHSRVNYITGKMFQGSNAEVDDLVWYLNNLKLKYKFKRANNYY